MATTFSRSELAEILANYDLGELVAFRPLTGGTVQTNILLETSQGKFVLKYYESRTRESVSFEAHLIKYLKDRKYPCPAVFRDRHGWFVGNFREKPYLLFEFVEGEHLKNPTEAQREQLIEKVAELHNITSHYRPSYAKYRWNYGIELCRELAGKAAERLNTEDARAKLKWLEGELARLELPVPLQKGVCHADFHFSNVLFKDGKFAALLDFDDANYTYLLYDLVGLIESAAWRYDLDEVLNFEEARRVVSQYQKYRELSLLEKRHLFNVYKLSILIDCVWYFERGGADDFYEKRKIHLLNGVGREEFSQRLFEGAGSVNAE